MSRLAKRFSIVALGAALAACNTVKLDEPRVSQGSTVRQSGAGQAVVAPVNIMDPFNPQSVLAQQRSVYFEFDSYTVTAQYAELVDTHARYLASRPHQRIVIEGHADERGGSEYNLALGQRRALAVRDRMLLLGVSDAQIETISFGKEKPKALGSNEAAWAENRRADIVYLR